jgi:hypothetical protein
MASKAVTQQVYVPVILMFNEFVQELFQSANGTMQEIQFKKREHGHNDFVMLNKIIDQALEITQRSEQSMKHQERFSLAFFNEFKFPFLSYLVTHPDLRNNTC